jgi:SAM-dependent methyltransferase
MNSRVRAGFALAMESVGGTTAKVYLTEQASPNYVWLKQKFPNAIGSEYTGDSALKGRLRQYLHDLGGSGEIRSEDVTRLTFPDADLDAVISFDVLEHVPDYRAALSEFARVLKPGGALILTAPFLSQQYETVARARLDVNGEVEHLLPPEYHGDPLEGDGILCFYHFGWDLLEHTREAGFSRVGMALPWSASLGLLGNLWTLVAYR